MPHTKGCPRKGVYGKRATKKCTCGFTALQRSRQLLASQRPATCSASVPVGLTLDELAMIISALNGERGHHTGHDDSYAFSIDDLAERLTETLSSN